MRKAAVALLVVVSIALLVWTSGLVYWQLRIGAAIRSMIQETRKNPNLETGGYVGDYFSPGEARQTLMNAGCRALPALIDALDPALDPWVLEALTTRIFSMLEDRKHVLWAERDRWVIPTWGDRRRDGATCLAIRAWWRANGPRVHQPWRFWSRTCASGREDHALGAAGMAHDRDHSARCEQFFVARRQAE